MKIFFICILFLQYIKIIFSIIPVWNLDSSGIKLLNKENNYKYTYDVASGTVWGYQQETFVLKRTIYIDQETQLLKKENNLFIKDDYIGTTEYDDIESAYRDLTQRTYYICPRGRYHVHYYNFTDERNVVNGTLEIDKKFNDNENWDLKCYYQLFEHYLFISYLNSDSKFYQYDFDERRMFYNTSIDQGLYAYHWTVGDDNNQEKKMFAIIKKDNAFKLKDFTVNVNKNQIINFSGSSYIHLTELKSKYQAFFTIDVQPALYYFINYNNETDFQSGFCNNVLIHGSINEEDKQIHEKTPFIFFENVTIDEIKFIYFTKYIYYKISIQNTNKFYYGIIDITLNKIIFNTNESLLYFIPYNSYSMLAITNKMAYQICAIANSDGQCLESCDNGVIIDSTNKNYCGSNCGNGLYTIKPDDICVKECDKNIYYIDDNNKECWLCKDKEGNDGKFKLINIPGTGCLKNKPNNSYYMNQNLYLVTCYTGFNYFEKGNCVEKCSDGFFHEENSQICEECDDMCKTCNKKHNCISCKDGDYLYLNNTNLSIYSCNKCYNNCKNCIQGKDEATINCLSCDINSIYKYLYNNNCIEECPQNSIISENNECIPIDYDLGKKDIIMLSIFIILTGLILLIIILCFCKSICYKSKKSDENLINEINTELIENKELYN